LTRILDLKLYLEYAFILIEYPVACNLEVNTGINSQPGETGYLAGHQGEHSSQPGVALPRQKLRPPEHQDDAADNRATR